MDIQRARQILESNEHYEVQLNGESIWIDQVDVQSRSVSVHPVDNEGKSMTVNADELQEV